MIDRSSIFQIFGSLMQHPQYLSETDKYQLSPKDFSSLLDRYIFAAIDNLYHNGASRVNPIDVETYLETNEGAKKLFREKNGIEFLQDSIELADSNNFAFYYNRLKKFNLLERLKRNGIDTSEFYLDEISDKAADVNKHFEELSIPDIIGKIKTNLLGIERDYIQNDTTESSTIFDDIEEVIEDANSQSGIGIPVQGHIFNEVIAGARRGTFVLRSAGSGVGKSRNAVGDACYIAFPMRYESQEKKWIQIGSCERVLFITTEQTKKEIQRMVLSYLTGFNETKFRYGGFTSEENTIIKQAIEVLKEYSDNFHIVKMPNPTIELTKTIVRENVLLYDIGYVFYDYIHISPSLVTEFQGIHLRNDEILLMFSTALKDLAVELDIFMMSSTQLNAKGDDNSDIKNESAISGSRSIINKADAGMIMSRPTKEELQVLTGMEEEVGFRLPNVVTDVYKIRSGEWNQVRIWSYVDLGNLRKDDLFLTDSKMSIIPFGNSHQYIEDWENSDDIANVIERINNIGY